MNTAIITIQQRDAAIVTATLLKRDLQEWRYRHPQYVVRLFDVLPDLSSNQTNQHPAGRIING